MVFHTGNIAPSVSFSLQDANYAYPTRQRILRKIRACERLQKFFEHEQASTPFCDQFEQRPNFASTFKLDGPFNAPHYVNVRK